MYKSLNSNLVLIILIAILSTTIIYSSFNEKLILNGTAYVRVDEDVRITNAKMSSRTGNAYETYNLKYSKNSVDLFVTLPSLTSTLTYQIEVTNKTNYVYVISDIESTLSNSNITYTVDYSKGSVLSKNGKTTLTITFKYADSVTTLPSDKTVTANILYTFERPTASMLAYDNTSSGSSCTNVQCALDELSSMIQK